MEGVSPEAVFLLGKDLNTFREIAEGLIDGNAELRLPGTSDPQTRERLAALLKQYEQTRTQAERDPGQPAGPGGGARGAGRDRGRQRAAAHRACRRCRSGWPATGGLSGLHMAVMLVSALLLVAGGCGLPAPVRAATRPRARSSPKASASRPSARSRKPSASTTPTRRPFCG